MGNPIRLIDPDGCDTAQRNAAIREAEKWKDANQNGAGDTYSYSEKGEGGYGSDIDCSGLLSKCAEAGGEPDPNHGDTGHGITNMNQSLPSVDPKDVVPGNFVLLDNGSGPNTHGGIITSVERDKNGNIVNEKMIASGGTPGSGNSGPKENFVIQNGKVLLTIDSYKKFDTKPDEPNSGTTNTSKTSAPKSTSESGGVWQWIKNKAHAINEYLGTHGNDI